LLDDAAAAFASLLQQAATQQIEMGIKTIPRAEVESTWQAAGSDRRIVFVP
jgi:hypothetical protein